MSSTRFPPLLACAAIFLPPLALLHAHAQSEPPSANVSQRLVGDPVRGEEIYNVRCGGCHSIDANRIGPRHRTAFGLRAGSVPDYKYSKALAASGIIWTEETLDVWLTNPTAMVPGTRMGFRLTDAQERAHVIAYLKKVAQDGVAGIGSLRL